MGVENKVNIDIARGGYLDGLVTTVTFGKYGIETRQEFVFKDMQTGVVFLEEPDVRAYRTQDVVVANIHQTSQVTRKLVRNK